MKPLELTSEHREKLLEMAEKLFPKHKFSFSNDNGDIGILDVDIDEWGHGKVTYLTGSIHWFEFCINWLATSIYNLRQPSTTITLFRGHLTQDVDHPVDYLYEQFKKIK